MNIVTACDSKFFHCLQKLALSVKKFYNQQLIVYDIGLTDEERKSLDAYIIRMNVDVDFYNYTTYKNVPYIQATHKPFCVKHYFEHFSEPMILVDSDCLFREQVQEYGFDVGVTLKPPHRLNLKDHYKGILNTGVIFFNTNATILVESWLRECRKPNTTDQKALTDILSETIEWKHYDKLYDWKGLKIKVFKIDEYNDYYLKNGKILHFKGDRHKKDIYEKLIQAMEENVDIYHLFRELTAKPKKSFVKSLLQQLFRKSLQ